jgi:class 3 adenylate cyclase
MPNRRAAIHDFYRQLPGTQTILEKAAATAPQYAYTGPAIQHAVVTRTDLNGYSAWARNRPAAERAAQLDAFFSTVVPLIEVAGGVFFRDEGDCIVSVFSGYFSRGATYKSIREFCKKVSDRSYGVAALTAKTCVNSGDVAFFQKKHEVATGDWSAEGEPFVRAARLEAAVSSIKHVVFLAADYDAHFADTATPASPGSTPRWTIIRESIQVAGLGATGGWVDVVRLECKP